MNDETAVSYGSLDDDMGRALKVLGSAAQAVLGHCFKRTDPATIDLLRGEMATGDLRAGLKFVCGNGEVSPMVTVMLVDRAGAHLVLTEITGIDGGHSLQ